MVGEITTLNHKVLDDAVEGGTSVAEALLASSKSSEVLSSLGNSLAIETKGDATQRLVALLDIEVHLVGDLGTLGRLGRLGEEDQPDCEQKGGSGEEPSQGEHDDGCFFVDCYEGKFEQLMM